MTRCGSAHTLVLALALAVAAGGGFFPRTARRSLPPTPTSGGCHREWAKKVTSPFPTPWRAKRPACVVSACRRCSKRPQISGPYRPRRGPALRQSSRALKEHDRLRGQCATRPAGLQHHAASRRVEMELYHITSAENRLIFSKKFEIRWPGARLFKIRRRCGLQYRGSTLADRDRLQRRGAGQGSLPQDRRGRGWSG